MSVRKIKIKFIFYKFLKLNLFYSYKLNMFILNLILYS